jgi:hypothetical protein
VGLIVIDTLNYALAGGDENSSKDMGALIAGANELREKTGAHIALIHHSGKDSTKGARGHSSLKGAVDSEFLVEQTDTGHIVVTARKQRDLDKRVKPLAFALRIEGLGTNQWGKRITSPVIVPCETLPQSSKTKQLPDGSQAALNILGEMLPHEVSSEAGPDEATVSLDDWRDAVCAAFEKDGTKKQKTRNTKFGRARRALEDAGFIEIRDNRASIPWTAWAGKGDVE